MADAMSSGLSAVEPLSAAQAMGMMGPPPTEQTPPPEEGDAGEDKDFQVQEPVEEETGDDEPAQESAPDDDGADLDADDEQPIEDTDEGDGDADEEPPIAMPKSWSKDDKEAWEALPRSQQERIAERERERSAEVSRRLQEAAERAKAVDAEIQQAQQARDAYKAQIDQLAAQSASFVNSEFSDIKSWEDVAKMQEEDPLRFNRWQIARAQSDQLQQEQQRLNAEDQQKRAQSFQNYVRAETAAFIEAEPDFADPEKAPKLQAQVRSMLIDDYGIPEKDLNAAWSGAPVSFHDHRFQRVIMDALRYRQAKTKVAAKPKANPKPKSPPPQKPGTVAAKGEVRNRALDQADKELTRTGGREAALRLMRAKRA